MRRCLLLAILLLCTASGQAFAATASIVELPPQNGYVRVVLLYAAAPGEANRLGLKVEAVPFTNSLVLHDTGAPVQAASGCAQVDAHTARCALFDATGPAPSRSVTDLVIDAGDGDDTVVSGTEQQIQVYGGAGADTLYGAGSLYGGAGNDVLQGSDFSPCSKGDYCGEYLQGGSGDDVVRGGGGRDTLVGDGGDPAPGVVAASPIPPDPGPGNDVLDGEAGVDTVAYTERRTGVRVDLEDGTGSGDGGRERDRVTDVEHVVGGSGPDLLLGNALDNQLRGGPGDDRLDGRAGDDYLIDDMDDSAAATEVDRGADTLRGGPGDDELHGFGTRDRLYGGSGDDLLAGSFDVSRALLPRTVVCNSGLDTVDSLPRGQLLSDCEQVNLADYTSISARPQPRRDGALRFGARCGIASAIASCVFRVTVRSRSSAPARRSLRVRNSARGTVVVRPRRPSRRGDVLTVAVGGGLDGGAGPLRSWAATWRVKL